MNLELRLISFEKNNMCRAIFFVFAIFLNFKGYAQRHDYIEVFDCSGNDEGSNNWNYSTNNKKSKKIRRFQSKKDFRFEHNPQGVELEINKSCSFIEINTQYIRPLIKGSVLEISFDVLFNDTCDAQALKFIHRCDSQDKLIFYLTKPVLDTLDQGQWNKIRFKYVPFFTGNKKCEFVINYFNPYLQRGGVRLRNLSIQDYAIQEQNNLVRNPSFEYYYGFPIGFNESFPGYLQYWNDFNPDDIWVGPDYVALINSNNYALAFNVIVSTYHPLYSAVIDMYEGYFAAKIINEYVYDSLYIPKNELRSASYLQIELKEELQAGKTYDLQFVIMLNPYSKKSDNSFGVKFSQELYNPMNDVNLFGRDRPLPKADLLFFQEPITNDSTWTEMKSKYVAKGGEKYLCFGVFENIPHIQRANPQNKKYLKKYAAAYLIDAVRLNLAPEN